MYSRKVCSLDKLHGKHRTCILRAVVEMMKTQDPSGEALHDVLVEINVTPYE